jgi:hypothetical protein
MRYGQRGEYTPAEQQRRERLRLGTADRFVRGDITSAIATDLRETERTLRQWCQTWRDGGTAALKSRGRCRGSGWARSNGRGWGRAEAGAAGIRVRRGTNAGPWAGSRRLLASCSMSGKPLSSSGSCCADTTGPGPPGNGNAMSTGAMYPVASRQVRQELAEHDTAEGV